METNIGKIIEEALDHNRCFDEYTKMASTATDDSDKRVYQDLASDHKRATMESLRASLYEMRIEEMMKERSISREETIEVIAYIDSLNY